MTQERNSDAGGTAAALGLRPLSARSVVASVLLGTHPPELPAATLVRLCGRFGIAEGTTRVALSRMVAAGELSASDGSYRLVGEGLLSRQRAQDEARHPPETPWDGAWRMALVIGPARSAAERNELRRAFAEARFAQWREGVWLRPDNLPPPAGGWLVDGPCRWVTARPEEDPAALAEELWSLTDWAEHGRRLLTATAGQPGDLVAGDDDDAAGAFTAAAAVLRHLRTDPLLPAELLPAGWPAGELRARYATLLTAIQALIGELTPG